MDGVDRAQYRKALREAAASRAQADEIKAHATERLRQWCVRARRAGMPITDIAREARLSRQGVYDLIGPRSRRS
jgi:phage-related baseplate assembly protein